ncbi:MAG TPA: uroporphyrinogen-III synthase [Candidatus Krumholzibacteria bacterium]
MTQGLLDRRIVNTRAPHQAAALDELLRAHGATPLDYPCIEIVAPDDHAPIDAALRELSRGQYAWLVLTSANTVLAVARRLEALSLRLDGTLFRTAAIGPATRDAAWEILRIETMVVPEKFVAESLGETIPVREGERVLLPESEIARPVLAGMLRERGTEVTVVAAYRTERGHGGDDTVPGMIAQGLVDAVTFTSASTVTHFLERIGREGGHVARALEVCAACIGPVTAEVARKSGFTSVVVPEEYTLAGMTDALEDYFSEEPSGGEERS